MENLSKWPLTKKGKAIMTPEQVELRALIDELFVEFGEVAKKRGIVLKANLKTKIVLHVDRVYLYAIMKNILSNAIQFTPRGGKVTLYVHKKSEVVALSVANTSEQLISEEQDQDAYMDNDEIYGKGSQLIYQFTELSGGEVVVRHEEQGGSIFTIYLPAYRGTLA
ncbi:HAMP domain-containing histidine kinase [Fulvivirga maritima]|uniref:sensor histidine kinase n=1 Tax=Fulvivirga maritima TaxID=2904247 RepID=UPI001F45DB42|nr:HAMP domain-containing sensor histidine kinase [Fulvivirga maritima]UII24522.1 HAMP domain-containing histidine kinase [Fulvivirga maritima]